MNTLAQGFFEIHVSVLDETMSKTVNREGDGDQ